MAAFLPYLVFCQALGALVGALTTVWSELAYVRAMRDGHIDAAERAHLSVLARGLRFGMTLLLLASFGLVVVDYELGLVPQPALSPSYWTSVTLALLVIVASWALSKRFISFALGSAVVFASWWFLAFLTMGQLPALSFGASIALLVLATAIFYALLQYGRFLILHKR